MFLTRNDLTDDRERPNAHQMDVIVALHMDGTTTIHYYMAVGTGAAGTAMAIPLFQPSGAHNAGKPSVILGNGPVIKI